MGRYAVLIALGVAGCCAGVGVAQSPPVSGPPPASEDYGRFLQNDHSPDPKRNDVGPLGSHPDPEVRDQINKLLLLPKQQLLQELTAWPQFQQMSPVDRERFVKKIANIRERQWQESRECSRQLGLSLSPEQQELFHQSYWQKRAAKEKALMEKIMPLRKQMEEELKTEMSKEFAPK